MIKSTIEAANLFCSTSFGNMVYLEHLKHKYIFFSLKTVKGHYDFVNFYSYCF